MRIGLALAVAAATAAVPATAANLITNGDFEAGNTGFTSGYAYSPGGNSTEGQYTVRSNPFPWNSAFVSRGDHTTGTGLMYVGNGAPTLGDIVWQSSTIAIAANTNYFFEAFAMNVCCSFVLPGNSDPNFTFRISLDGGAPTDLATLTIPANQAGTWFGLSTSFNSGTATTVQLSLINANNLRQGNDFAVDDITLSTRSVVNGVPEPSSWAMLLAGFGAVGGLMRRRRTVAAA
ncbi:PEPxxWA-CTERM sorting domain-containing protein [Sandarakinorhabdus oryzae]|uniref:PEPxxWA-CTERM sorting domain-containing protein n=1 Tax=Sandarakinorhabdus oryzae TaxID=2675220 RepID=UPI001F43DA68|nr:PEPxxWA-CTERM sorting domain-containing protein [Sandarakinorhabdus oryzae]